MLNIFISSLLEKGKMFVFSQEQLSRLLSSVSTNSPPLILDIGSGDGYVTDKLKHVLKVPTVHVTEMSSVMRRVLRRRGYK